MRKHIWKIIIGICFILIIVMQLRDKTEIEVLSFINEQTTIHTAYYNGKYYYYDKNVKGVWVESDNNKIFLFTSEEPSGMAVNSKYIYLLFEEEICQYDVKGNKIAVKDIGYWDNIYASDKYLYVNVGESIVIFPAEDISQQLILEESFASIQNIGEYSMKDGEEVLKVCYGYWDMGTEFIVFTWYPDDETSFPTIKQEENGYRICHECSLVSKESGAPLLKLADNLNFYKEDLIINGEIWGDGYIYLQKFANQNYLELAEEEITGEVPYGKGTIYVDGQTLCISSSAFGGIQLPFSSYRLSANGPMCEQKAEKIWCIDIETGTIIHQKEFSKGNKVIYMDAQKYIVYHDRKVDICDIANGEVLKTIKMDSIQRSKKYVIELCGDRLFFYQDGEVVNFIEME